MVAYSWPAWAVGVGELNPKYAAFFMPSYTTCSHTPQLDHNNYSVNAVTLVEIDSVLEGESNYDFGAVPFANAGVEVSHDFLLRNKTGKTLSVERTIVTCGCTTPTVSSNTIASGEEVNVNIALKFSEPSHRQETATIVFDDGSVHKILVSGSAVATSKMFATVNSVPLNRSKSERVLIEFLDETGTLTPTSPIFDSPPGVRATFDGWNQLYGAIPSIGRPARWHGWVVLKCQGEVGVGARVTLTMADTKKIPIDLTGWPG